MIETKIKLYHVDELPEEVQEQVLNEFRNINVDYGWWDFILEDFFIQMKHKGILVETNKIFFDLSYSGYIQCGNRIRVDWTNKKLQEELRSLDAWGKLIEWSRVNAVLEKDHPDELIWVVGARAFKNSFEAETEILRDLPKELLDWVGATDDYDLQEKLEAELEWLLEQEAKKLYKRLVEEYEYQVSDEAIIETLNANDFYFTKTGQWVDVPRRRKNEATHLHPLPQVS